MRTVIFFVFLSSCGIDDPCRTYSHYDWGFNYEVETDFVTEYGIHVDISEKAYPNAVFELMDKMTKELENCLGKTVDKSCLEVKIPDNWFVSETTGHQLLQDKAPSEGCEQKGLKGEECRWRAGLQDDHIVITTPNLYLYKDPVAKIITNSDYVWEEVPQCLNPNVDHDWMNEGK